MAETPLEMAERHVREAEERVAGQEELISHMGRDRDCTEQQLEIARTLLTQLQRGLEAAREHLQFERGKVSMGG